MKTGHLFRLSAAIFLFAQFILINGFSQTRTSAVSGIVRNERSEKMPGVTVTVTREGQSFRRTTQTGNNGEFSVSALDKGNYRFSFSHVGYSDSTTAVYMYDGSPLRLEIRLQPGTSAITGEVVVVGYGRTARKDVTGAVKSVQSAGFNKGIINTPEELLQGKVSGVNVTSASGEPGAIQNITVRGPGGVRTGSTPLFVVDGLALDNASAGGATNPLSFINPQDIESIDVLKDASATAIYGSRGANGVILITTKKGKTGFNTMSYSVNAGMSSLARALPVFNTDEYRKQVTALGGTLQDFGGSTDWQNQITRNAFTQNHNLALSGGANKLTYYGSFGMQLQQGILKGNDLKRYTGRINITQKLLDDRLTIDVNLSASNTVNTRPDIGGLIGTAISTNPTIPAYGTDGKPYQFQNGINPLTLLALEKDITSINRLLGSITGSLNITRGLVYRINFGIDNATSTRDLQSLPNTTPLRLGRLATINNYNRNHLIENYITYTGATGDHRYTALAGHSYQKIFIQGRSTSINNFPISGVEPIYNPGLGQDLTLANNRPGGYALINELQSFFSRLNYQFKDKYLFTATVRADGSSKFGQNNKYGVFPSFSAAWVISKEHFMANSFLNSLKLRAGWGQTGNQEIPSKITQALFTSQVSGTTSYPLYPTGAYPAGTSYSRLANPNIQWEVSAQTDLGLDFELFKGKLSGTVDYFRKVTNNILLEVIPADPVQPATTVWTNVENMKITNRGVELELGYKDKAGAFTYSVGGNITFIDNKVTNSPYSVISSGSASGSGLTSATINGYVNNQSIGTFFLQEFTGFTAAGMSQYRDANGDGIVNDKDRLPLGSALPKTMYNFFGTLAWKGFDLAVNFNGVSGNKLYDNTANAGFYKLLLSKGVNTTAEAIAYPNEAVNNAAPVSSRFLKDGKFLRLNNLTLGYTFNTEAMGISKYVSAIRFYVTGQNLFVITPYKGYDPEVNTDRTINGISSYGIDYLSYPKARTFLAGLTVNF
ncbi:SusC/RagA family TonB-linked outer membrane protein [Sediminibacterium soli]|uniref:SusC/RagA family TonB-linked outer membrane protein n=1 Tax=Sediminibacterium soli TaxID=2698829 RepID=UPI0013798A2B|nr:SusC/RagA family TonB-linked outer membrane protein [Sediminibacterium soli]NCI48159.1 SusC/RagA family TonB-linked outer membrane protein [Sediminibacterium soli]